MTVRTLNNFFSAFIFSAHIKFFPITKTCLYSFDPLKPHFYTVRLGFKGNTLFFSYFCSKT